MKTNLPKSKYVLAVSGGIDSMTLLELMLKEGNEIVLVHFNHLTRGNENTNEYNLIKKKAEEYNLKIYYKEYDFSGIRENFHNFSHNLRYDFFYEVLKLENADLVLAHHLDDLLETHLMTYLRGASLKGYAGFQRKSDFKEYTIHRPLIDYSKKEIIVYANENQIEYLEDSSNNKLDYTRNKIRHTLSTLNIDSTKIKNKIISFSDTLYENFDFIQSESKKFLENKFSVSKFNDLHIAVKKQVLNILLSEKDVDVTNEKLLNIIKIFSKKNPSSEIHLGNRVKLRREYDEIVLFSENIKHKLNFLINGVGVFEDENFIVNVSFDKLPKCGKIITISIDDDLFPFTLRNWESGDYINYSFGKKKLSRLFIDKKVPRKLRESLLIVEKEGIIFVEDLYSIKRLKNLYISVKVKND